MTQSRRMPPRIDQMSAILAAMDACYGDLTDPNYRRVYENMGSSLHRQLVDELRASGLTIAETTDPNDDVATRVIASQGSSEVELALSGVGPFAVLMQLNDDEDCCWITDSNESPSSLAAHTAKTVEQRGFSLLSRDTVAQKVPMNRADGSTEATVYQALFTDSDMIP